MSNGTITAAATATPVQPGPTPGAPAVTVAGSTSPIGVVSSPTVDGSSVTTDTKMNIGLDSVMESQAAQLNLLLYQIYRPYFNGKEYFLSLIAISTDKFLKDLKSLRYGLANTNMIFTWINETKNDSKVTMTLTRKILTCCSLTRNYRISVHWTKNK